jgi:2-oxoglutarate dehydrogenase E1 component
MGYWSAVHEMIEEVAEGLGFKHPRPRYAGRRSAASPATGYAKRHAEEQAELVADALIVGKEREGRIGTRRRFDDQAAPKKGKAAE